MVCRCPKAERSTAFYRQVVLDSTISFRLMAWNSTVFSRLRFGTPRFSRLSEVRFPLACGLKSTVFLLA
jgi:hypothetical protein